MYELTIPFYREVWLKHLASYCYASSRWFKYLRQWSYSFIYLSENSKVKTDRHQQLCNYFPLLNLNSVPFCLTIRFAIFVTCVHDTAHIFCGICCDLFCEIEINWIFFNWFTCLSPLLQSDIAAVLWLMLLLFVL